ncbi:MAG: hypothetical protein LOY03_15885 [Cyclobacteriaceae bacterium]|nr:hypothetical protein [Cyclobacteriaceae bacterium]
MKRIALSLIVALGLASCEEEGSPSLVCGKKDPLNELPWLKQEMSHLLGGPTLNAVVLYIYEGREVLELQGSVFSSTNQHQYYCDGEKLDFDDPVRFQDYRQKRVEKAVLYGTKIWE